MITVRRMEDCHVPSIIAEANVARDGKIAIADFVRYSLHSWAGFVDERFACMWGLVPLTLLSDSAYLWLIVNELIDDHKFVFIRHSQIEMAKMLEIYPTIVGHCDRRHIRSMQWLKWLGAKFDPMEGQTAHFTIVRV